LVVVVILGLLAGLAIPATSMAVTATKRTACASNLRQIGLGIQLYAHDHDGWLPTSAHHSISDSWIYLLEDYMGSDFDNVRLCPADPKREQRKKARGTSYILNEYTAVDLRDPFGNFIESYRNMLRLPKPSETIIVFTVSDRMGVSLTNDHTHSRNWNKGWKSVLSDIQPDRHRSGSASPDHTKGSANYLFADGHVENIQASDLKKKVEQGINPALPPS
jgi:prepilin-type processing-associated H-X9-DG protein